MPETTTSTGSFEWAFDHQNDDDYGEIMIEFEIEYYPQYDDPDADILESVVVYPRFSEDEKITTTVTAARAFFGDENVQAAIDWALETAEYLSEDEARASWKERYDD